MQKELFCRFRTGGLILFYNFIMLCIKNDYFVQMNTTYSKALFFWSKTLSNYCLFFGNIFCAMVDFHGETEWTEKNVFQFFCCSLADAVCSPLIMQFIFFRLFLICFFHILLLPHIDLDIILSWANFYIIFLELYLCMCIVEKSAHTYTLIMWIHNFFWIREKKLWIIFFRPLSPLSSCQLHMWPIWS